MKNNLPSSPARLAAEAREALRRFPPKTGRELFVDLVRKGFINARGQVTRLIGGSAEPEPHHETWTAAKDGPARPTEHQQSERLAKKAGNRDQQR